MGYREPKLSCTSIFSAEKRQGTLYGVAGRVPQRPTERESGSSTLIRGESGTAESVEAVGHAIVWNLHTPRGSPTKPALQVALYVCVVTCEMIAVVACPGSAALIHCAESGLPRFPFGMAVAEVKRSAQGYQTGGFERACGTAASSTRRAEATRGRTLCTERVMPTRTRALYGYPARAQRCASYAFELV
jgi:hypothetical protein